MKQCPNCRNQIPDDASFCPVCGTSINGFHSFPEPYPPQGAQANTPVYTVPAYAPPVLKINPYDHTSNFDPQDIATSKLYCMACYLLDFVGIFLALMGAKDSAYGQFHIRQAMKFTILEALLGLCAGIFCWTLVIPVLAAIALILLLVLKFLVFIQLCKGKAIEPPVIRKLKFLS